MPKEEVFAVFGRPDINEAMDYFRSKLSVPLDGTNEGNRRFAKLTFDFLKKEYPGANHISMVKRLIDIAMADEFWRGACTSFRVLYNNKSKLMLLGKQQKEAEHKEKPAYRIVNGLRQWD
jgi:hypothetical protein